MALLLQALCTGVFVGMLELFATTRFLEFYRPDETRNSLSIAFVLSGGLGILITAIYSYFSKQLKSRSFAWLNMIVVLVAGLFLMVAYTWSAQHQILSKFYLVVFVFSLPLTLIVLQGFWATVKNFLSPSRGKQLFGLIEASLLGGMLMGFLLTVVLLGKIQEVLVPGIALLTLLLGSVAQLFILSGREESADNLHSEAGSAGPMRLFSHKYTSKMAMFSIFGVLTMVFIYYAFLSEVHMQTGSGEIIHPVNLPYLLLVVFGLAVLLGWFTRRFVFGWLKRVLGLGITLILTPMLLLMGSFLMILMIDFRNELQLVLAFSLIYFIARMFRDSLDRPSMRMIYQSLNPRDRRNVKAGIDGVLSQVAILSAGLILALYEQVLPNLADTVNPRGPETMLVPVFIIAVIWILAGVSLYKSYHKLLKVTLESDRILDPVDLTLDDIVKFDLHTCKHPVELIAFNPYFFHYTTHAEKMALLSHDHSGVRRLLWQHFMSSSPGIPEQTINQLLGKEQDSDIMEMIRLVRKRRLYDRLDLQKAFIRERLEMFNVDKKDPGDAVKLAFKSGRKDSVFAAINQVAEDRDISFVPQLTALFRDRDVQIQGAALSAAGQLDVESLGGRIIDFLDHPVLYATAWSALVNQGERVLDDLESAFNKPDVSLELQKRIVSAVAASGGEKATRFLLQKLEYQHRDIFQAVVQGLYENHFSANEIEKPLIQSAIMRMVDAGVWTMAAKISVRSDNPGGSLPKVIEQELWEINELILMLLTMIYDIRSVRRIRISLMDRESDDRGMALELLELMLNDSLKPILVAYFHDVSVREKIDKLKGLYPVEIYPVDQLLKKILNRNAAQMGDFIRISVLELMGSDERYFDEQQIKAQGFHPNPRIRTFAAQLLWRDMPGEYGVLPEQLDFPENLFPGHDNIVHWYMDTTMRLASWQLFKDTGINSIFRLVSKLRAFNEEEAADPRVVCLVRSISSEENSDLTDGIALFTGQEPDILEQIRYLASIGACEAFLVDHDAFTKLLFDDKSLLHVFCGFLNKRSKSLV